MYGRRNVVKGWGFCGVCGDYGKNKSYEGRKWGHLYFIPLFPLASRVRVVMECGKCSNGIHIPEKELATKLGDIRKRCDSALAALIAGQKEFDDEGAATPCAASLAGAIEMLYSLRADDYVRLVLAALQEKQLDHAYHLVNGEVLEFQGKPEEAAASYRRAAECDPSDSYALMSLGATHLNKREHEKARLIYEKALELSKNRVPALQVLLAIYGVLKDYAKLVETYEECFRLVPELVKDKKAVKAYKKACKKVDKKPVL
jgi:tetratricopeptide (TPR) repeat protein